MPAKALMVLGTGSGVGKSFLAAGLCRLLSDAGVRVAPFKAQNMSNNSFVTAEGGEMGRAQVVQAECARLEPHVDMNPVLLKPAGENRSQVIVQGRAIGHMNAREYFGAVADLERAARQSYERLAAQYEVLVMEGAGSAAEVNLREQDFVNMRMAEAADADCLLLGDIDRGGVFAQLVGTLELLEPRERERVSGLIINKFRGDRSLLKDGLEFLRQRTGKAVWGVIPFERDLFLDEEDSVSLELRRDKREEGAGLDIAVILLPRISNFTDFEILRHERGVRLRYVRQPEELGRPDLLILPGTKATLQDYGHLKEKGFCDAILEFARRGGRVLGVCGGYQMMGEWIRDPKGAESAGRQMRGLGLLKMTTEFEPEKILRQVDEPFEGYLFGRRVRGRLRAYEIHMGRTTLHDPYLPFGRGGAADPRGRLMGTYYHGLFDGPDFRSAFLEALRASLGYVHDRQVRPIAPTGSLDARQFRELQYTRLAAVLREHLDPGALRNLLHPRFESPILRS